MPIYMDRHDIEGATAKAVADAHQKDLKLQDKYGVKLLTYWFDEGRGSAFCLMDASAKKKVKQLHEEAHGMIPHKIMEVNPDTVEAFLGRIEDPQPRSESLTPSSEAPVDSAFRVIMFTDMKDSTAITTRLGDTKALELFRTHNSISRGALKEHNGREIQHTGDGFMVAFTSASHAVACAIAIQRSFASHNKSHPDTKIKDSTNLCECMKSNGRKRSLGETNSTNFKTSTRKLYQIDSQLVCSAQCSLKYSIPNCPHPISVSRLSCSLG